MQQHVHLRLPKSSKVSFELVRSLVDSRTIPYGWQCRHQEEKRADEDVRRFRVVHERPSRISFANIIDVKFLACFVNDHCVWFQSADETRHQQFFAELQTKWHSDRDSAQDPMDNRLVIRIFEKRLIWCTCYAVMGFPNSQW